MIKIMKVKNRVSEKERYTKNGLFVISPSNSFYLYLVNIYFIRIKTTLFCSADIVYIFLLEFVSELKINKLFNHILGVDKKII